MKKINESKEKIVLEVKLGSFEKLVVIIKEPKKLHKSNPVLNQRVLEAEKC